MQASKRIQGIQSIYVQKEKQAERALVEAKNALFQQQTQLQQLVDYQAEYITQRPTDCSVNQFQAYQGFVAKISQTVEIQQQVIVDFELKYQQQLLLWRVAHQKQSVIDTYQQNLVAGERQQADKKEQKELDDLAGRQFPRRRE
ncbi:MAG: flagellar FliJ family protein [Gammaproteobacteria bacterium]|nr:flagellar FliJ family protein [Gammaproteobacteria bacterium]